MFACQILDDHPELFCADVDLLRIVSYFLFLGFDYFLGDEDRDTLFILNFGLKFRKFVRDPQSHCRHPVHDLHSQAVDQIVIPVPILSSLCPGSKTILSCLPVLLVLTSRNKVSECSSSRGQNRSTSGKPNSLFHSIPRRSFHH